MTRNQFLIFALGAVGAIFSFAIFAPSADAQDKIKFHSSIEDARDSRESDKPAKPIVLYFGASWCAPCLKMKAVTFEVLKEKEAAREYQWVKYDIDDSPEVARRYGIVSVPTVVVLDSLENPVGARGGFMTVEKLLAFVSNSINNPTPIPPSIAELTTGIEESDGSELNDAVDLLIREMASPNRTDRQEILLIIKEHKQKVQPRLVKQLEDTDLRTRAAAGLAILTSFGFQSEFDPFADPAKRKIQIAKIQKLLPRLN